LLPAIDGVETADEQLAVVLQKASISPNEPYQLFRFRARAISESEVRQQLAQSFALAARVGVA
jgi:hypothetical protein